MLIFPCDSACKARRSGLYIVYGVILFGCVALALCHFIMVYMKRRRVRITIKEYQQRRESFAVLASNLNSTAAANSDQFPHAFQNDVNDAFKITTDGSTELAIEVPEDYYHHPFPLLRNGTLENNGRGGSGTSSISIVSFTDHRNRPLAMQRRVSATKARPVHGGSYNHGHIARENIAEEEEEDGYDDEGGVLSQRKTNEVVTVDVHNRRNSRESGHSLVDQGGNFLAGPRTLAVATVSQSYHNAISVPVPVGGSDQLGGAFGRISRPQSALSLSAYDISDIVSSSPEVGRKTPKKSPNTC